MKFQKRKNGGFTLIELMVVLVLIVGLTIAFWPQITQALGIGDAGKVRTQVTEIQSGAMLYKQRKNIFDSGFNMTALQSQGFISKRMGTGTAINPWGGNYTVAANSSDSTQYIVTVTGIKNAAIGAQLQDDYATSAISAAFSGSTLTLTFQG